MNEIISFENAKQRVMLKKSTYVGKFSIIARGESISNSQLFIKCENTYIKNIYESIIRGLLATIFNRNNFSEGEYKINSEDILNKEFDFFVYSIRKNGEKVVNCIPKVNDIIFATLLTRILQNYEI